MGTLRRLTGLALAGSGAALALRALTGRKTYRFEGKVVVVTGGSRGLGLVLARELAREGARLAILARNPEKLEEARRELAALGADVLAIACDVRDMGDVRDAIERAAHHFGRIDVLVNNAGVLQAGPLEHMTLDDFDDAMATNYGGALHASLAAIPHLRRAGDARIVNVASIGGKVAVPHMLPYTASKFALVGLSDGLRAELAKDGIKVTTVCPGLMRTGSPINVRFKGDAEKEFAWFALSDRLPLLSMDARSAARAIIAACRRGSPRLLLSASTKAATLADALVPALVARATALANRFLLPRPIGARGRARWGFELDPGDEDSRANNELNAVKDA